MLIPAAEPISSGCATPCSLASATRNAGRYERAARWIQDGIAAVPESFQVERILVTAAARTSALLSTAAMHIPLPSWVLAVSKRFAGRVWNLGRLSCKVFSALTML